MSERAPTPLTTHTRISKKDVCWRLTAVFDSGSLHHVEFLPEEAESERVWFLMQCGEEGGAERDSSEIH